MLESLALKQRHTELVDCANRWDPFTCLSTGFWHANWAPYQSRIRGADWITHASLGFRFRRNILSSIRAFLVVVRSLAYPKIRSPRTSTRFTIYRQSISDHRALSPLALRNRTRPGSQLKMDMKIGLFHLAEIHCLSLCPGLCICHSPSQ